MSNRFAEKVTFLFDPQDNPYYVVSSDQQQQHSITSPVASTCCVCRSGSAADTQQLAEQAREELESRLMLQNGNMPTVTNAAYVLKNLIWDSSDASSCSLICAGYDHVKQRGIIYSLSPGGTLMEEPTICASGSGSTYILGHLDEYREKILSMEEDEALEFAENAIELAMSRDGSSGGFVRLYVLDQHGKRTIVKRQTTKMKKDSFGVRSVSLPNFAAPVSSSSKTL